MGLGRSGFTVTFDSADAVLSFDEIVGFSGMTVPGPVTYDKLLQIPSISGLSFGATSYSVAGNDISDAFCIDGRWCFGQNSGSEVDTVAVSGWGTYAITSVTAVPEPGSLALLGVALAGLTLTRRRKA